MEQQGRSGRRKGTHSPEMPSQLKDNGSLWRRKVMICDEVWNSRSLLPSQSTFGSLLLLVHAKLWSFGPLLSSSVLKKILHSAISALLLSFNQSSRLALLSDRRRTLSRPWWRLREMYICRYWLISPVNIMQGSVVLMLRTEREGKCCCNMIIYDRPYCRIWSNEFDFVLSVQI